MTTDNKNLEKPIELAPRPEAEDDLNLPIVTEESLLAARNEQILEKEATVPQIPEKVMEQPQPVATTTVVPKPVAPVLPKSDELKQIEGILSEGLDDLYKTLPDNRKAEFRQQGEITARGIEKLLQGSKVKVHKIIKLIIGWLKMIPGVNKFFLEQSTKIKVDELLELKDKN